MKVQKALIDHIDIPPRLRAVDTRRVNSIADSIKAIGLQQPITLWAEPDGPFILVAGAHRLVAARSLGWEEIDAVFTEADDVDRQIWEIDENLMRAELTATQQAEHLAKRKELWEQRVTGGTSCPTSLKDGRGGGAQHQKQFAAETADATGVDKRTVNRAVARAQAVPEDVRDLISGTRLDTGVYLDHIKGLDHQSQPRKVQQDLRRISESKPPKPLEPPKEDPDAEQFEALKRAWNKASSEARRRFEVWLLE